MMSSDPLGSPPGNTVSLFPVLAQRFNAYFERLPRLHGWRWQGPESSPGRLGLRTALHTGPTAPPAPPRGDGIWEKGGRGHGASTWDSPARCAPAGCWQPTSRLAFWRGALCRSARQVLRVCRCSRKREKPKTKDTRGTVPRRRKLRPGQATRGRVELEEQSPATRLRLVRRASGGPGSQDTSCKVWS